MPHYKDKNDALYFLDSSQFEYVLPADCVAITDDEANAIRQRHPSNMSVDQVLTWYTASIQKRLDDFAKTRGYDGILSACTYATDPTTSFAAEGQYCVNIRGATWTACYQILSDVQAGTRTMPSLEEITTELPVLAWPE